MTSLDFKRYSAEVTYEIEKKIGGKPSFGLDELLLDHGFQRGFSASVTAEVLIDDALRKARESGRKAVECGDG